MNYIKQNTVENDMSNQPTILWHDYETWGANPHRDRPAQFAAIRTDLALNVIGDPIVLYCQLADDYLPHPEAALVTGLSPQECQRKGVPEAEFIKLIDAQFSQPNTCVAGYNNIRFDDELSRSIYYRNFYDPYAREWQNGNSRWDLIDVVRACYALRPDGINWPLSDDGNPSFRLERLTQANDISHGAAHDALSDVYATIAMAKLIQTHQPRLYQFLFALRDKRKVSELLSTASMQPIVHVSSKIPASQGCISWLVPVATHPTNKNEIICIDLHGDINCFSELSAEQLSTLLYTKTADLEDGQHRPPIKTIHLNRCPVVAPAKTLTADDAKRLGIDRQRCLDNLAQLKAMPDLATLLTQVFSRGREVDTAIDPDFAIYQGFFDNHDKDLMARVRHCEPEKLGLTEFDFHDARLYELLFRYRARNFPHTLTPEEQQKWQGFCFSRLREGRDIAGLCMDSYMLRIENLVHENQDNQRNIGILKQLYLYTQ